MTGKSMIRLLMAGAGLALAIAAVACSGDDDDDGGNGASGGNGTPATATVTPLPTFGVPTETPGSGGAVPVESATPSIPQFPADSEPPGTSVTANGVSVEAGIGTFCWTMLCVDKIGVPTKGTLTVSNGDKVSFAIPDGVPPLREGLPRSLRRRSPSCWTTAVRYGRIQAPPVSRLPPW